MSDRSISILLRLIVFLIYSNGFSQTIAIDEGQFELELIHSKKLNKIQASTNVILRSKTCKTVYVKLRMTTSSSKKEWFDINKFSLIDDTHKLRSRPMNISYQIFTAYSGFYKLVKEPLKGKNINLKYEPNIEDSFEYYDFDGYTNLEVSVDYDGWGKQKKQVVYFKPQKFKTKKLNFFFPFLKEIKSGVLFYGNEKVAELNFN